ncbi:SDR family NAD(P)-dependent oxidoreductase [Patulibacter americanus]|uniref:SDR family NAD(P)-dependent oxidoreductase n=1 Tax=Patulibacter americanus TaxID=588672 RepID=UPI0003B69F44|nr:SDR family NAD(P)-dependent oxidoreductase [Patulibacter americanus]
MTTSLITGGNKGLGRETARRLHAAGHDVWIGARDEQAGRATADELGVRFVALDVTRQDTIDAAVATIAAAGGLDVLVNNAAIADGMATPFVDTDVAAMNAIMDTNVLGPMRLAIACWPLLQASPAPVVVNVSSSLGSLGRSTTDPELFEHGYLPVAYPASKAALNMVTVKLARALPRARVNAVNPGFSATDLNDHLGPLTVEVGVEPIVQAALLGPDGPTGTFFEAEGVVAW